MDREMLDALAQTHKLLVTVEDGTVVNGFGAALAALVQTTAPDSRVVALGVPDRTYEHAPRAQQLADVGLTGAGIAARIRELLGTWRVLVRSEEHTSELQSPCNLVCRLLLEKKKNTGIA